MTINDTLIRSQDCQGPIVRIPEKLEEIFVPCEESGESSRIQISIAVWLHCKQVVQHLLLLGCRLYVDQLVRNPVSVGELEAVTVYALRSASFYELEILNRDKDWAMRSCLEGTDDEIVHDGTKGRSVPLQ